MDLAAAEIRDRIDRIRGTLPDDVGRIRVSNFSTTDIPILQLSVSLDGSRAELERLTEDLIVPRLLRLEGVADVNVRGLQDEQVMIDLDPDAMASLGVTVDELTRSLRANNVDLAGGYLIDGGRRYFVRSVGSFSDLEEIATLPIAGAGGVRIGDVGVVRRGVGDQDNVQRLNLAEAVTVRVFKGSDANVVSVVRAARGQLAGTRSRRTEAEYVRVLRPVRGDHHQPQQPAQLRADRGGAWRCWCCLPSCCGCAPRWWWRSPFRSPLSPPSRWCT